MYDYSEQYRSNHSFSSVFQLLLLLLLLILLCNVDIIPLSAWKDQDNPTPWDHCSTLWTQSVLKHWGLVKDAIINTKVAHRNITTIIHDRQCLRVAYVTPHRISADQSLIVYHMNIQFSNAYGEYYFIAADNSKVWCYNSTKFNDSIPIILDENTASVLDEEMHRCELVPVEMQQLTKRWDSTQCNTSSKKSNTESKPIKRLSKFIT